MASVPFIVMNNRDLDLSGYNYLFLSPFVFHFTLYCYIHAGDWFYSLIVKLFGDKED